MNLYMIAQTIISCIHQIDYSCHIKCFFALLYYTMLSLNLIEILFAGVNETNKFDTASEPLLSKRVKVEAELIHNAIKTEL